MGQCLTQPVPSGLGQALLAGPMSERLSGW